MGDCNHDESLAILEQLQEAFTTQPNLPHFYENLPAIPIPKPTPEENAFLHHDIGEKVGTAWNLLNAIVIRHEPEIRSIWDKKSAKRRFAILVEAWGGIMPEMYRPDFRWFLSAVGENGHLESDTDIDPEEILFMKRSKKHTALIFPYINLEHLVEKKALPLFINSRGRAGPNEFLQFNVEATNLARACGELRAPNLHGFRIAIDNVENYAEIVPSGSTFHSFNLTAGETLLAMEIHDHVMRFLTKCCLIILNRTDPQDLMDAPILPDVPIPRKSRWADVSCINWEAPFVKPMEFNHHMIKDYLLVRRSAAEDHIWDLRENPGYFAATVTEWSEHLKERMNFPDDPDILETGTPKFWNAVIMEVISHAVESVVAWHQLYIHFSLIHERVTKDDPLALSWFRQLPEDCAEKLHIFELMLGKISERLMGTLWRGWLVSPYNREIYRTALGPHTRPTMENYKLNGNLDIIYPPPGVTNLFKVMSSAKHREPNLLTLTRLMHPLGRNVFGYRNLVDDMGIQFITNPMENLRVSPWCKRMFTDLGLISTFKKEVDKHRTFCLQTPFLSGKTGMYMRGAAGRALLLLKEMREKHRLYERLADLGTPIQGRFDYPVNKPRTAEVVKRMQQSERNLHAFWKKADDEYKEIAGSYPLAEMGGILEFNSRQIHRTPDWVEPGKEEFPKEVCKKKVSSAEETAEKGVSKKRRKRKSGRNSQKTLEEKSSDNLGMEMGSDQVSCHPEMICEKETNPGSDNIKPSADNVGAEIEIVSFSESSKGPQENSVSQTENDTIQVSSPANGNEISLQTEQIPVGPMEDAPIDRNEQTLEGQAESPVTDPALQSEAEASIVQVDNGIENETEIGTEITATLRYDELKTSSVEITANDAFTPSNDQEVDPKTEAQSVCVEAGAVEGNETEALKEETTEVDYSVPSRNIHCESSPLSHFDDQPSDTAQEEDQQIMPLSKVARGRSLSAGSQPEAATAVQTSDILEIENECLRNPSNPFHGLSPESCTEGKNDEFICSDREQDNEPPINLIRQHSPVSRSDVKNYTEAQPIDTRTDNAHPRILIRERSTSSCSEPESCVDVQPSDTQEGDEYSRGLLQETLPDSPGKLQNPFDMLPGNIKEENINSGDVLLDHSIHSPNESQADFENPPNVIRQTESENQENECTIEPFRTGFPAMMSGAIYSDRPLTAESFTQIPDSEYRRDVCPRRAALDSLITDKIPVEGSWNQVGKKTDDIGGTGCLVNTQSEKNGATIWPAIVSSSMVSLNSESEQEVRVPEMPLEGSTTSNSELAKPSSPAASISPNRLAQVDRTSKVAHAKPQEAHTKCSVESGTFRILANGLFEEITTSHTEEWWSRAIAAHNRCDPFANFLEYPYRVPGRPRGASVPTLFNVVDEYEGSWYEIVENLPARRFSDSTPKHDYMVEEIEDSSSPAAEWEYVGYEFEGQKLVESTDIERPEGPLIARSSSSRSRSRSSSTDSDVSQLNLNETAQTTDLSTSPTVSWFGSPDLEKLVPASSELATLYEEIRVLKQEYQIALARERAQEAMEELAESEDRNDSMESGTANSKVEEQANTSTDDHGSSTDNHETTNDTPDSSTFGDLAHVDDSKKQKTQPLIAVPWNLVGVRRGKKIPAIKWPSNTAVLENNPFRQLQELEPETEEVAMDEGLPENEMDSKSMAQHSTGLATNNSVNCTDVEPVQSMSSEAEPDSNVVEEEDVFFDSNESFPGDDEVDRDASENERINQTCNHGNDAPPDASENGQKPNVQHDTSFTVEETSINEATDKKEVKLDCQESSKKKPGKSKKSGSAKKKSRKALKNKSAEEFDEFLNELKETATGIDKNHTAEKQKSQKKDKKPDYEIFYVTKTTHRVLTTLYHEPVKNQPLPSFTWTEFLFAMEEIGFTPRSEYATLWHFCLADVGLGIQIHQPHGGMDKKVPFEQARNIGRRLTRQYGHVKDSFRRYEDCEE
ncbi:hypothetical protein HYFRA_00001577 [Hymenoscyphus fraxineus]|uniref:Uncharacterized protein n=1 Tax=Hymenoscyphus fraxineus TaxID=746836 RepID=A0A9N9L7U1_9HELO|nr:hypothetical protein HYFRA_00001577 [Hymenoscyphus fraxineus]